MVGPACATAAVSASICPQIIGQEVKGDEDCLTSTFGGRG